MNELYEYINVSYKPKDLEPSYKLKSPPIKLKGKVRDIVEDLSKGSVKDFIIENVGQWFEENSSRRNIKVQTGIDVKLYLIDPDDKLLGEVVNEMTRIGVVGEMINGRYELAPYKKDDLISSGINIGCSNIELSVSTFKQFREDNYIYNTSTDKCEVVFRDSKNMNEYNYLSPEAMTDIRQKFYGCMEDTVCRVIEFARPFSKNTPIIPRFGVYLFAEYNNSKLKSFLKGLREDESLQKFASKLDSISRGFRDYYSNKGPGDYVGD